MVGFGFLATLGALGVWWYFPGGQAEPLPVANAATTDASASSDLDGRVAQTAAGDWRQSSESPSNRRVSDFDFADDRTPAAQPAADKLASELVDTTGDAVNQAWARYKSGHQLAARNELNAMLRRSTSRDERNRIRTYLNRIAEETLFSKARLPGDPLVDSYTIQANDRMIRIAQKYSVPYEILMRINGIKDATRIRENQRIKVLHGPFNARIRTADFRIDLYLQDTYVRSFPIGIGAHGSTPTGVWKVTHKLPNPTYFPPAGAEIKKIIPGDDPKNPLGEHWIGLEGVDGEAAGQEGYGIHGTIEPDSIGKAVSLGCIRMHNQDVAYIYTLLQPGRSTVTIQP